VSRSVRRRSFRSTRGHAPGRNRTRLLIGTFHGPKSAPGSAPCAHARRDLAQPGTVPLAELVELAGHLANERHEGQSHVADASGDLPTAGSGKRQPRCPEGPSIAVRLAPVDARPKRTRGAIESLTANRELLVRNAEAPPHELHRYRPVRVDEARVGEDHPVGPKRGKELPVAVPVGTRRGSRWMLPVRRRHTTRGAPGHSLAGADENRGQNDPDQGAGTVPRSHHLQLYSRSALW
jgi:hypothetical protein